MVAVSIKMNEDGFFNFYVGVTDLGTGFDMVFVQIVVEELCIVID